MPFAKWAFILAAIYVAFAALMYVAQRAMMYHPERIRTPPAAAGLPQAEEVVLDTADGEKIIAWHMVPRGDAPVVLYFHGNGGSLRLRVDRFQRIAAAGVGLVALSYRGYGGSTGSPSEEGLIEDARAAYAFATARYPASRIVLWGESLGTGVAVALGSEKPIAKMILDAPYTSALDLARASYPFLPVRLLMKDQFRSDERIARVTVPVMIMHGEADRIIPISYSERLYEMIPGPKRFLRIPGGHHVALDGLGGADAALKFIRE